MNVVELEAQEQAPRANPRSSFPRGVVRVSWSRGAGSDDVNLSHLPQSSQVHERSAPNEEDSQLEEGSRVEDLGQSIRRVPTAEFLRDSKPTLPLGRMGRGVTFDKTAENKHEAKKRIV